MTSAASLLLIGNFDGLHLDAVLSNLDVSLATVSTFEQAQTLVASSHFAAILFSRDTSTADGISFARTLRPGINIGMLPTPFIFMPDAADSSGTASERFSFEDILTLDAVDILPLPFSPLELASKLRFYIQAFRQQNIIRELRSSAVNNTVAIQSLQLASDQALADAAAESDSRHRLYETILATTPDLVYVFDLNHRFTYANKVLLTMWGKSWDEAIGKNCLELGYEPWHAEMHGREIEQVKATKEPIRGEVAFEGTFGRRIYDYIFVPVIGADGNVEAIAGTTRDITELHEIQERLKQKQQALQMADRRKDEFLAMLAHELRNPLAPISAAAQIMLLGELDEQRVRKSSQIIDRQVRHMVKLVDDLLDVSRVTRGLVSIDQSEQDLKLVIHYSTEQVRPLMESKRHQLSVEISPESAFVMGDRERLIQVVTNLLNNAAKYTPDGGQIAIALTVENGTATVTVSDNGIGISPEDQPHIYDLFAQAKRSSDRSLGGLGLGLALVKSMVELHHGEINCYSAGLKAGSVFTVKLPLVEVKQAAPGTEDHGTAATAGKKLKVLVVDDNVDAAHTLASFLELSGHDVLVEHEARQALERAVADRPHVCILDIGLPGMDGNELARSIRAQSVAAGTKLIAVTGYGQDHDRNATLAAGFDHHLVKPVDVVALSSLLAEISEA